MSRFAQLVVVTLMALTLLLSNTSPAARAHGPAAQAAATPTPRTATLSELHNAVYVRLAPEAAEQLAANGLSIPEGGTVRTGAASSARLDFSDGTLVRIKENTTFAVTALETESGDPFTQLSLAVGKLWIILSGGTAEVNTPVGVASVRGSLMGVSYNPALKEIKITCLETIFTCAVVVGGVTYHLAMGEMLSAPPFDMPRLEPIDPGEHREWVTVNPDATPFIDPASLVKDHDGDSVPDSIDNCPNHFNSDQADNNGDGIGNACEPFNAEGIIDPTPTATEEYQEEGGEALLIVAGGSPPPGSPFGLWAPIGLLPLVALCLALAGRSAPRRRLATLSADEGNPSIAA